VSSTRSRSTSTSLELPLTSEVARSKCACFRTPRSTYP
jgi:hypothetical protein